MNDKAAQERTFLIASRRCADTVLLVLFVYTDEEMKLPVVTLSFLFSSVLHPHAGAVVLLASTVRD